MRQQIDGPGTAECSLRAPPASSKRDARSHPDTPIATLHAAGIVGGKVFPVEYLVMPF